MPERLHGSDEPLAFDLDHLVSTEERPGFQILAEAPPREVVVGAIGKVWSADIPFVHVADGHAFAAFQREGFIKVAWAIRVSPFGDQGSRLEIEVRVDATDEESWKKFQTYFRFIGPFSRLIRRSLISTLERELGSPEAMERMRRLPGDELLPDAEVELTHGITIRARPEEIWPWLCQTGCGRAGYYSIDWLDNGGKRSARELHPDLCVVRVGQVLPATPSREEGFEVLRTDFPRALILGGPRLGFGPGIVEPISFAMDRRMLLGVKERAESHRRDASGRSDEGVPATKR